MTTVGPWLFNVGPGVVSYVGELSMLGLVWSMLVVTLGPPVVTCVND